MKLAAVSRTFGKIAIVLGFSCALSAAPLTIKLGTLAPAGTTYHKTLMTMGETWKKESAGAVELRIFAGGKAGGESEMVGLMMENSLQAAMLTATGLSEIEPAAAGLQFIPMAFRTLEEVQYVGDKLHPMIEERLAKKGFIVLFWSDAGWVRLFSSKPVTTPDELKKLKLFTWAGDNAQVSVMKSAGFNPVPIETADIVPSLQTGLINAVPMPPFFALASQVDTRAPHMLEINWAPLIGACLVRKETWEKLPPDVRERLKTAALEAGKITRDAGHREMTESVVAMGKRGLKVSTLTPEADTSWRLTAESMYPMIRGKLVPADVFDLTMKTLEEFRARRAP